MRFENEFVIPYDRERVVEWYYRSGAFARLAPSFNHGIDKETSNIEH
jgi:hypothetical protein